MKCIVCNEKAEYVFLGNSYCQKHVTEKYYDANSEAYLVTFKDGSIEPVTALGLTQARAIIEAKIREGTLTGEIEKIEKR